MLPFDVLSPSSDVTLSGGSLVFATAGTYKITFMFATTVVTAASTVSLYLNGVLVPGSTVAVPDVNFYSGQAIVTVTAGQTLTVAQTSGGPITVNINASISAARIA